MKKNMEKPKKIANFLLSEHGKKRSFKNLSEALMPSSLSEAYSAQDYFHEMAGRGDLGGYKIALSSKTQQNLHNIRQPLIGGLFKEEICYGPKVVDRNVFQGLGIEIELGFQLSNGINDVAETVSISNLNSLIDKVYPAIELVEDRNASYQNLDPLSLICDNTWSGGLVLGKEITTWPDLNFLNLKSNVYWNDEEKRSAFAKEANPFENLCWLLNDLRERRKLLCKGMIIITGSVFQIRRAVKGDTIRHVLGEGFEASLQVN